MKTHSDFCIKISSAEPGKIALCAESQSDECPCRECREPGSSARVPRVKTSVERESCERECESWCFLCMSKGSATVSRGRQPFSTCVPTTNAPGRVRSVFMCCPERNLISAVPS